MFSKSLPLGIFGTFQEKRGKKRVERSAEARQKVGEELEEKLKAIERTPAAGGTLFCYISFSIQEHIW